MFPNVIDHNTSVIKSQNQIGIQFLCSFTYNDKRGSELFYTLKSLAEPTVGCTQIGSIKKLRLRPYNMICTAGSSYPMWSSEWLQQKSRSPSLHHLERASTWNTLLLSRAVYSAVSLRDYTCTWLLCRKLLYSWVNLLTANASTKFSCK